MAGIGFILRKLQRQDNLIGSWAAYLYSAMISTGPWIFTIFALGSISVFAGMFSTKGVLFEFRRIVIYNFAFSLVGTAPIFMVVTRYLSDRIYEKDVEGTPRLLYGGLCVVFGTQLPLGIAFYFFYAKMDDFVALAAVTNFLVISCIWLLMVFITYR